MKMVLAESAGRDLKRIDFRTRERIIRKLHWFAAQTDPLFFAKPILDSELGDFRFRIGDYRVLFEVIGDLIYVHRIGHRSEIYRN